MSISTRRGDDGQTDLMFGRRVAKCDPRVVAGGAVDELNAALGLVRTSGCAPRLANESLPRVQAELVVLMGELATHADDMVRYVDSGFKRVSAEMVDRIGEEVERIERDFEMTFKGWAMPGDAGIASAAFLDLVFPNAGLGASGAGANDWAVISSGRRDFGGVTLPTAATLASLAARLAPNHVLSTENHDELKAPGTEHGDDTILITIGADGFVAACYVP